MKQNNLKVVERIVESITVESITLQYGAKAISPSQQEFTKSGAGNETFKGETSL